MLSQILHSCNNNSCSCPRNHDFSYCPHFQSAFVVCHHHPTLPVLTCRLSCFFFSVIFVTSFPATTNEITIFIVVSFIGRQKHLHSSNDTQINVFFFGMFDGRMQHICMYLYDTMYYIQYTHL